MTPGRARAVTPEGGHFTAGYYDRTPWSPDGKLLLVLRLPQHDHVPLPDEEAVVCAVDLPTGGVAEVARTRAWNHQQGSMQQWLPREPGAVVVNDREGDRVFARVVRLDGTEVRRLPRPVYCLAPDGRTAASLDFARIQRRGYSYAVTNPKGSGGGVPGDDGLWLMDVENGAARLVASHRDMAALHPHPDELERSFVWLNHAIFNRDGSRVMVLFRYFPEPGAFQWKTFLYTVGLDGAGLRLVLPDVYWRAGRISHQMWGRTPDEMLVDADFRGLGGEFNVFRDEAPPTFRVVAPGAIAHGHQVFSPDGAWLLTDSYPDAEGLQRLKVAEVSTGREVALGSFRHPRIADPDCRCDLHPRWRPDGRAVAFDSMDDGARRVYLVDLEC